MKKIELTENFISGGGFAAGACGAVAGIDMFLAAAPAAGIVVSMSGWGVVALVGANVYCAGYFAGKW